MCSLLRAAVPAVERDGAPVCAPELLKCYDSNNPFSLAAFDADALDRLGARHDALCSLRRGKQCTEELSVSPESGSCSHGSTRARSLVCVLPMQGLVSAGHDCLAVADSFVLANRGCFCF